MNKTEAAQFLKVSPRTLQRLSQQGKISVAYKNSKTGAEADYDETHLQRYLDQQKSIIYRPATMQESQALATIPQEALAIRDDRLITILESLRPPQKPTVPIESKPLLKLHEAAALTGLSRQTLRTAIDNNKLKAQIQGRAWRIKRADLDSYISKSF
jgi:excisionase family DNA binding protein